MKRIPQLPNCSEADIERQVHLIVADILDVDESAIQISSRFREDLGADSLDLVTLIIAFSNAFEANVCDGDVRYIQTVGEAIAYLKRNLQSFNASQVEPKLLAGHSPKGH
jgi:acyl carrier protein